MKKRSKHQLDITNKRVVSRDMKNGPTTNKCLACQCWHDKIEEFIDLIKYVSFYWLRSKFKQDLSLEVWKCDPKKSLFLRYIYLCKSHFKYL